jgi:hypothetical protein
MCAKVYNLKPGGLCDSGKYETGYNLFNRLV